MVSLLLNSTFSSSDCSVSKQLGMHKELGSDTARTAGPNQPMPQYNIMQNYKTGGVGQWRAVVFQELAMCQLAGGEQLQRALFVLYILLSLFLFSPLFCPIELSLSQPTSSTFFLVLFPIPLGVK